MAELKAESEVYSRKKRHERDGLGWLGYEEIEPRRYNRADWYSPQMIREGQL